MSLDFIIQKMKGQEMLEKEGSKRHSDEDDEFVLEDEPDTESNSQLLARIYDTCILLQKRGIVEINIVEEDDGKKSIVIVLNGVEYDKDDGFVICKK